MRVLWVTIKSSVTYKCDGWLIAIHCAAFFPMYATDEITLARGAYLLFGTTINAFLESLNGLIDGGSFKQVV
jgi:hypothetical protein